MSPENSAVAPFSNSLSVSTHLPHEVSGRPSAPAKGTEAPSPHLLELEKTVHISLSASTAANGQDNIDGSTTFTEEEQVCIVFNILHTE